MQSQQLLQVEVEPHDKPDVLRQQLEDQFNNKVVRMPPGEVCFMLTLPAAHNGPVRINWHNMTKEQTVAMVEALHSTLPYPQKRLTDWVAKTTGGVQKRTQRPARQQRKGQQAHSGEQEGEIMCVLVSGVPVLQLRLSLHNAQPVVHKPPGTLCVATATWPNVA